MAFSYLRFSSPQQAKGDSRRRQGALAEAYAERNGLTLDSGLSFHDLGVSAYRGENARDGALRAFLDAVEHGLVPANCHLLVESLDRLSRERVLQAQALFLQIIGAGVTIVTLSDGRIFSSERLNEQPTDLLISLISMMRANEESALKSQRVRAAHQRRREQRDRFHRGKTPSWIVHNAAKDGYVLKEPQASLVRRVFQEALAGRGLNAIALRMNQEKVPTLTSTGTDGRLWCQSSVRRILVSPTVVGTCTRYRPEDVGGRVRYFPEEPIEDHYPAVVSKEDFRELEARRLAFRQKHGLGERKARLPTILQGLARCPVCNRSMMVRRSAVPSQKYLLCLGWREARVCSNRWVRYPEIEEIFQGDVQALVRRVPQPVMNHETRAAMLNSVSARLRTLRARRARELTARPMMSATMHIGALWSVRTDEEIEEQLAIRGRLRAGRNHWVDATLRLKLEELQTAALTEPLDRRRLNVALRRLLSAVVIDWPNSRLVLQWRHGGETYEPFVTRRLLGTKRNPTPPLREPVLRQITPAMSATPSGAPPKRARSRRLTAE